MKRGPFPMWPAFPTPECYDPLRLPLDHPSHFPGSPVIGQAFASLARRRSGPRRLSRVPTTTIRAFNAHYAGWLLSAHSSNQNAFHGLRRHETREAPSWPTSRQIRITTLTQASLTLQTARSHPLRFAPDLSITHGGIATRDPGVSPDRTHTGRPSRTYRSYVMRTSLSSSRQSSLGARRHCRSGEHRPKSPVRSSSPGAGQPSFGLVRLSAYASGNRTCRACVPCPPREGGL